LVLYGHSLGAAAAVILGMLLEQEGRSVAAIYASGQPKVTDRLGAEKWAGLPVLRLSCEGDPVPLLPPRMALSCGPLRHIGPEILLLGGGSWVVAQDRRGDEETFAEAWRSLKRPDPQAAVALHLFFPNYYLELAGMAAGDVPVGSGALPESSPRAAESRRVPRDRRRAR
jgi:hypothetical protein